MAASAVEEFRILMPQIASRAPNSGQVFQLSRRPKMMIRPLFVCRAALIQDMRCKPFRLRWGVPGRLWPFLTLRASSGSSAVWLGSRLNLLRRRPLSQVPDLVLVVWSIFISMFSKFCFVSCLGPKAKNRAAKAKPAPRPAGALPLSDVALAGKTIPEKCSLVRWGPIYPGICWLKFLFGATLIRCLMVKAQKSRKNFRHWPL